MPRVGQKPCRRGYEYGKSRSGVILWQADKVKRQTIQSLFVEILMSSSIATIRLRSVASDVRLCFGCGAAVTLRNGRHGIVSPKNTRGADSGMLEGLILWMQLVEFASNSWVLGSTSGAGSVYIGRKITRPRFRGVRLWLLVFLALLFFVDKVKSRV